MNIHFFNVSLTFIYNSPPQTKRNVVNIILTPLKIMYSSMFSPSSSSSGVVQAQGNKSVVQASSVIFKLQMEVQFIHQPSLNLSSICPHNAIESHLKLPDSGIVFNIKGLFKLQIKAYIYHLNLSDNFFFKLNH